MKKILLMVFLSLTTVAAQDVQLEAIGFSAGAFWAQNKWDPGFIVESNLDMGEVLDFVFFQPTVSFMHATKNENINGIEEQLALNHFVLGTKIIGYITNRPRGPYLGTALHFHFISSEKVRHLELSNSAEVVSTDDNKVSLSILSGYIQKFRRFSIFLEAGYTFVPNSFSHATVTTGFLYHL